MKTIVPEAVGAIYLAMQLGGNHQVDGFLISVGSSRFGDRSNWSSRAVFLRPQQHSSARGNTCRMMNAGFGHGKDSAAASKSSSKKGKGKKATKKGGELVGSGEATAKPETKGSGQRQLFMQFTCNVCGGVSQYMINKTAYEDGIVICTCQSCGVRHLISDNLKKMDFPAFGNNIEAYMQSKGTPEEVTKGRAPGLTPELIAKYEVSMGKDGVLTLSPKDEGGIERDEEPS